MSAGKLVFAAAALALLLALSTALAAPVTVTVTFVNAPESLDGAEAYFYTSKGLAGHATVRNGTVSLSLEGGVYYMKVVGKETATLLRVDTATSTTYTVNYTDPARISVNVTVKGFPSPIDFQVTVAGANATTSSRYTTYAFGEASVAVYMPEELLFPAVFGYRLKSIQVNNQTVSNGFTLAAGDHQVTVEYELSMPSPWAVALIALVVVAVAFAAVRRSGPAASLVAAQTEWVE